MPATNPQKWSSQELEAAREVASARFILERQGEGPTAFHAAWDAVAPDVDRALVETNDLLQLTGDALVKVPAMWQTLRYFCAPPISEEDLWTLVGRKFKSVRPAFASVTASALASVIDVRRFPWVEQRRAPSEAERSLATVSTTVLLAHETLKTRRRGRASRKQEDEVSEALIAAGVSLDPARSPILRLDELTRGHFSRERKVDGAKCDIPIRLKDGRLLAIECKVSNGPKNSWKRLQREVGGKAERWRQEFGSQVLTGAVLAGVYDLRCLENAQNEQNVYVFWQHDLAPLITFVTA